MKSRRELVSIFTSIALFVFLEAAAVLMIVNGSAMQRLKIMGVVRSAQAHLWQKTSRFSDYLSINQRNADLAQENLLLRERLEEYRSAAALLDSVTNKKGSVFSYTLAHIVRNSTDRQHNYIILDRGSEQGIDPGMGVVTENGVIGIVDAVSSNYCRVISFLNTGQSVSVKFSDGRDFAPMTWDGSSPRSATMHEVPASTETSPGDTVLTSGYSTIYPPDIPVGIVESFKLTASGSKNVEIALFENFRSLHTVYIVKNNHREELDSLK